MSPFQEEYRQYNIPNWDGYGGEPITQETIDNAEIIYNILSKAIFEPWVAPGGDGSIGFELEYQGKKFFLDVRGKEITGHFKK